MIFIILKENTKDKKVQKIQKFYLRTHMDEFSGFNDDEIKIPLYSTNVNELNIN